MADLKDAIELLISFFKGYGLIGVLVLVLVLIVQDPDRATKLKIMLLEPLFKLFKIGSNQYIATKVSLNVNEFFKKYLSNFAPSLCIKPITIKWVTTSCDPSFAEDGTLILRMTETNDQSRNILAAAQAALPLMVCTTTRSIMSKTYSTAIDLTLLKKLSQKIGKHSIPIFQKYFLNPEIDVNDCLRSLFTRLVNIDSKGIFISIFLEEINLLGEAMYAKSNTTDKSTSIENLLVYLCKVADKQIGEDIELSYMSEQFAIGLTLVAKQWKVDHEGIQPYIKSIDSHIRKGCESIYIIAYDQKGHALERLLNINEADQRINVIRKTVTQIDSSKGNSSENMHIVLLRPNLVFNETSFNEKLAANAITISSIHKGQVVDVSEDSAVINICGMNAYLYKKDASWKYVNNCSEILVVDHEYNFLIKEIVPINHKIIVSRKIPVEDPWNNKLIPAIDDIIHIRYLFHANHNMICEDCNTGLEIFVPINELSWQIPPPILIPTLIGNEVDVQVYDIDNNQKHIFASPRRLVSNPWPLISKRFPKGTKLKGTVLNSDANGVYVSLPDGFIGIVPKICMETAGYEYSDYTASVVQGQGMNVVVTKVFIEKQRIRLDLERNMPKI